MDRRGIALGLTTKTVIHYSRSATAAPLEDTTVRGWVEVLVDGQL